MLGLNWNPMHFQIWDDASPGSNVNHPSRLLAWPFLRGALHGSKDCPLQQWMKNEKVEQWIPPTPLMRCPIPLRKIGPFVLALSPNVRLSEFITMNPGPWCYLHGIRLCRCRCQLHEHPETVYLNIMNPIPPIHGFWVGFSRGLSFCWSGAERCGLLFHASRWDAKNTCWTSLVGYSENLDMDGYGWTCTDSSNTTVWDLITRPGFSRPQNSHWTSPAARCLAGIASRRKTVAVETSLGSEMGFWRTFQDPNELYIMEIELEEPSWMKCHFKRNSVLQNRTYILDHFSTVNR